MESWAHEGARDEDVDSIEAVEESVQAKDDLVKNMVDVLLSLLGEYI
jgi:hypothetical protein